MDPTIRKAAIAILRVFKQKNVGSGGFLHYTEFGKVLRWEGGQLKHEMQREALWYLRDNGFVNEGDAGLELTDKGQAALKNV